MGGGGGASLAPSATPLDSMPVEETPPLTPFSNDDTGEGAFDAPSGVGGFVVVVHTTTGANIGLCVDAMSIRFAT